MPWTLWIYTILVPMYLYFYFWSRGSGVITLRRPCVIEYCNYVFVCFMLILMFCLFACKIYEYEYDYYK